MKQPLALALGFLLLPLALAQAGTRTEVSFWHSMDGPAGRLLSTFAQEFNARQGTATWRKPWNEA